MQKIIKELFRPFRYLIQIVRSLTGECKMPRFARLTTEYRYKMDWWKYNPLGNFGDCFQGFAVENIFNDLGIPASQLAQVNRDELDVYHGEPIIVPMQGWFGYDVPLVWSSRITPVFFGFHLSTDVRDRFIQSGAAEKMKKLGQPIGCRDKQTTGFLQSLGVDAYFSGCLSLTFPKRQEEPKNGKVFIVDVEQEFLEKIPDFLRSEAESVSQLYLFKYPRVKKAEYADFEDQARKLLNRYKTEARLVITSRIHVAMPCTAMGIPVIFLHTNPQDCRFDVLDGIVPIHSLNDSIDWNPPVPDIEERKAFIKKDAVQRIRTAAEPFGMNVGQQSGCDCTRTSFIT